MLAADGNFHPDFRVDLLTEELSLGPQFDEPRIAGPGPLVRGDDDLLRLADLGADERGVEALEEPALSDDDRRLDVDLLLVELAFFLRDLVMGRVEKSLGPVRVDRPGIVLEPSNVALFDRLGDQPLTASTF